MKRVVVSILILTIVAISVLARSDAASGLSAETAVVPSASPVGTDAAALGTGGRAAAIAGRILGAAAAGVFITKILFGTKASCEASADDFSIPGIDTPPPDIQTGRKAASCSNSASEGCASAGSSAAASNGLFWDSVSASTSQDVERCPNGGNAFGLAVARAATRHKVASSVEAVVLLGCQPQDIDQEDPPLLCLPATDIESFAGVDRSEMSVKVGITSGSFLADDPMAEDNLVAVPEFTTILFEGTAELKPDGTFNTTGGLSPSDFAVSTAGGRTTATLNPKTVSVPLVLSGDVDIDGDVRTETEGQVVSVGGIVEEFVDGGEASAPTAGGSGSSAPLYAAIAGGLGAAVLAIAAGGWYARRRWLQ